MDRSAIAHALQRAEDAFLRKPALALHDDAPATAVLGPGLRAQITSSTGMALQTDLPSTMGGDGDGPSPGWLMRAGLAACLSTAVAMRAARRGITLRRLEVTAESRSDARGLLGDGPVGPLALSLRVHIESDDADDATLCELVAWADAHSPVSDALRRTIDLRLQIMPARR